MCESVSGWKCVCVRVCWRVRARPIAHHITECVRLGCEARRTRTHTRTGQRRGMRRTEVGGRGREGGGGREGERGKEGGREGGREEDGKGTLGLCELERSNLSLEVILPSNLIELLARQRMYILRVVCIYVYCTCVYVRISTYVRTCSYINVCIQCTYKYVCTYMFVYKCMHVYVYTCNSHIHPTNQAAQTFH
jgi:hypothetical protein